MKKKVFLVLVLMGSLLLLTGCSKKAITIEEFTSSVDTNKYTVGEYESGQIDTIIEGLERGAYITNGAFNINFYVLSNPAQAIDLFGLYKEEFEAQDADERKKYTIKADDYEIYELTTDAMYNYICRVKNTLVYVSANAEDKDEVKSIIKNIGY